MTLCSESFSVNSALEKILHKAYVDEVVETFVDWVNFWDVAMPRF